MSTALATRYGRDLVDPVLFDRLTARVMDDEDTDRPMAERICDQALAFLATCAANPGKELAPSATVDAGWHAFLLYTREYAAFCGRLGGGFIHHVPTGPEPAGFCSDFDTTTVIAAAGFEVDRELWASDGRCSKCKKCHQCHAGCWGSP